MVSNTLKAIPRIPDFSLFSINAKSAALSSLKLYLDELGQLKRRNMYIRQIMYNQLPKTHANR
jgi:hypothetical protein